MWVHTFLYLLTALGLAYLGYHVALALLIRRGRQRQPELPLDTSRRVSILLAARNEEANILRCLNSLSALRYPTERLQILVGDDRSEDATPQLIKEFIQDKPWFEYLRIETTLPGQRGKQNVLAQLARKATGEIYLITDADIAVKPDWAAHMAAQFTGPEVGTASAPTAIEGQGWWAKAQDVDWTYGSATFKAFAEFDKPITAIGNNMAISARAYWAVGGYEALDFSITEDLLLFDEVRRAGFQSKWVFHESVLNLSTPIPTFLSYLHQRKRWFKGGLDTPWYAIGIFFFHSAFMPLVLLMFFVVPLPFAVALLATKLLSEVVMLREAFASLRPELSWRWLLFFPLYTLYFTATILILPIFFALPGKIVWKGRQF